MLKKVVIVTGVIVCLALAAVGYVAYEMGPRNLIGMLRYDESEEGTLKVGDRAPDVTIVSLDGQASTNLSDHIGDRPLVLIFGSFT